MLCGAALRPETLAVLHPLLTLAIAIAVLVIGAALLQLLWNAVVPFVLDGWPSITFWQALALQLVMIWLRSWSRRERA